MRLAPTRAQRHDGFAIGRDRVCAKGSTLIATRAGQRERGTPNVRNSAFSAESHGTPTNPRSPYKGSFATPRRAQGPIRVPSQPLRYGLRLQAKFAIIRRTAAGGPNTLHGGMRDMHPCQLDSEVGERHVWGPNVRTRALSAESLRALWTTNLDHLSALQGELRRRTPDSGPRTRTRSSGPLTTKPGMLCRRPAAVTESARDYH